MAKSLLLVAGLILVFLTAANRKHNNSAGADSAVLGHLLKPAL
jgi:hypothetical protein